MVDNVSLSDLGKDELLEIIRKQASQIQALQTSSASVSSDPDEVDKPAQGSRTSTRKDPITKSVRELRSKKTGTCSPAKSRESPSMLRTKRVVSSPAGSIESRKPILRPGSSTGESPTSRRQQISPNVPRRNRLPRRRSVQKEERKELSLNPVSTLSNVKLRISKSSADLKSSVQFQVDSETPAATKVLVVPEGQLDRKADPGGGQEKEPVSEENQNKKSVLAGNQNKKPAPDGNLHKRQVPEQKKPVIDGHQNKKPVSDGHQNKKPITELKRNFHQRKKPSETVKPVETDKPKLLRPKDTLKSGTVTGRKGRFRSKRSASLDDEELLIVKERPRTVLQNVNKFAIYLRPKPTILAYKFFTQIQRRIEEHGLNPEGGGDQEGGEQEKEEEEDSSNQISNPESQTGTRKQVEEKRSIEIKYGELETVSSNLSALDLELGDWRANTTGMSDYGHDASAWGRRIFDTDEIDIPLQAEVHSKLFVQKEDIELEDVLIDFMTRDREKLKELGLWDVIYDKGILQTLS
ncbi:uncharacterized protein DDB_G0290587, partial [Eurytemora carolleeae]|uniref:uncharacterized protein DDB_G0290587 n=1 Tax=Eurytemora carolleeae TaxID=1294199 RepID=UPI000C78BFBB